MWWIILASSNGGKPMHRKVAHYLIHSFLYYQIGHSVISDEEYDSICRYLLDNFDAIEHEHKHLLDKEALAAGTAYHLKRDDYPARAVLTAWAIHDDPAYWGKLKKDGG